MRNLLILFVLFLNPICPEKQDICMSGVTEKKISLYDTDTYNYFIDYIKQSEGFSPKRAYCFTTQACIGYGHAIKKGERFTTITEKTADSLVRIDYNINIDYLVKHTDLRGNKLLAIAHFCYNVGMSKYLKSNLKRLVDRNQPIDAEIVKWQYIYTKTDTIKSKYLYKMRMIELEVFKKSQ